MHLLSYFCLGGATLLAVIALVYQWRDVAASLTGTMGGEMTTGLIWMAASALAAAGAWFFMPWYCSILVFFAGVALSFLVRLCVAGIAMRVG